MSNYIVTADDFDDTKVNNVLVLDANGRLQNTPVYADADTGALNGQILDVVSVTANTYTLDDTNVGKQIVFSYAGTVTVTIAAASTLNPGAQWLCAAASGTTVNFSLAGSGAGDTLLGATGLVATESCTIILRSGQIFENDPRFQVAGPGAGTVTSVTSANADLTVANTTTTPVITLASVGGVSAANVASGANLANAATDADTASTIAKRDANGMLTLSKLLLSTGANASIGTGTLTNGTVTITNTSVTASSVIFVVPGAVNTSTALGNMRVVAQTAGVSFQVDSRDSVTPGNVVAGDQSSFVFVMFN